MTRSELIIRLLNKHKEMYCKQGSEMFFGFEQKDCEVCVRTILDEMVKYLCDGSRIEIRGFGTFAVSTRPARLGRNPKTGDKVMVPQKKVAHFKSGKELRLRLNPKF